MCFGWDATDYEISDGAVATTVAELDQTAIFKRDSSAEGTLFDKTLVSTKATSNRQVDLEFTIYVERGARFS